MEDLIKIEKGLAVLNPDVVEKIATFERAMKEVKQKQADLKEQIKAEMQEKGIIKIDSELMTISYIDGGKRERLDTKALKEELPDIYDSYVELSEVKPQIRVRLK